MYFKKVHVKKKPLSDPVSFLAPTLVFLLCQIFQAYFMFCFHYILFSLLKSHLASSFPLELLSENYQLIPLCQTKRLSSVLILMTFILITASFETPHPGDIPFWAFCLFFLTLPSTLRPLQDSSFLFSQIILRALGITSPRVLPLISHFSHKM